MDINAFNGIILYNIEMNGCLNGVCANMEAPAGVIYNEIARKRLSAKQAEEEVGGVELDLEGTYDCQYFDPEGEYRNCDLVIKKEKGLNAYSFEWTGKGERLYVGRGYKMNARQVVVHYGE